MAKIQFGIFFDNAQKHIDEIPLYLNNVYPYKVNDSGPYLWPTLITQEPYVSFIKNNRLEGNMYYKWIQSMGVQKEAYDPNAGLNATHLDILLQWITASSGYARAAIFDWDRTLTVFEGIHFPSGKTNTIQLSMFPAEDPTVAGNAILEYACGGKERLSLLRHMFYECHKNNVQIYILTNNMGCNESRILHELLTLLISPYSFTKICSIGPPSNGDKGFALAQLDEFSQLLKYRGAAASAQDDYHTPPDPPYVAPASAATAGLALGQPMTAVPYIGNDDFNMPDDPYNPYGNIGIGPSGAVAGFGTPINTGVPPAGFGTPMYPNTRGRDSLSAPGTPMYGGRKKSKTKSKHRKIKKTRKNKKSKKIRK